MNPLTCPLHQLTAVRLKRLKKAELASIAVHLSKELLEAQAKCERMKKRGKRWGINEIEL